MLWVMALIDSPTFAHFIFHNKPNNIYYWVIFLMTRIYDNNMYTCIIIETQRYQHILPSWTKLVRTDLTVWSFCEQYVKFSASFYVMFSYKYFFLNTCQLYLHTYISNHGCVMFHLISVSSASQCYWWGFKEGSHLS